MKHVTVQGVEVPAIGLGTWRLTGRECYRTVSTALDLGYRHVDTAEAYGNERQVGAAIQAADVDAEEIFLTTKVFPRNATDYSSTRESVGKSLERLGVDTLDLVLIHWPNPLADLEGQLQALFDMRDEGYLRNVGVSNFSPRQLKKARKLADGPIFTDQVQFHPFKPQRSLLRYCQDEDLLLTAYSPLAHGGAVNDDLLAEIGARYDKSAAQVALRWAVSHRNVVAIPKATSRDHLEANLEVFDFSLTESEMDRIARKSSLATGVAFVRGRLGV